MAQKKKGFIAKFIEGPDISEEKARSMLPGNRWELGADLFKTNLSKLVLMNLLVLVFLIPILLVIIIKPILVVPAISQFTPFSQNLGAGYPAFPSTIGLSEAVDLQTNLIYLLIPIFGLLASVGLSGGMYVTRNLVWSEGIFLKTDFWSGVKKNYGQILLSTLFYSILLIVSIYSKSFSSYYVALGNKNFLFSIMNVLNIVFIVLLTIMYMYMLTLSVTYELKFSKLIKNAFILTIGLLPTNLFFVAFSLLPYLLLLIKVTFLYGIFFAIVMLIGFSWTMLVWTNYSHWVFDQFINDKVPGAKKNRGIYKGKTTSYDGDFRKSKLKSRHVKPITDVEVEIAELPTSFSRADLVKLEESKEAMRRDSDLYKEHKPSNVTTDDTSDTENNKNG